MARGQRQRLPDEHPGNRRLTLLAASRPDGPRPAWTWASGRGSWLAEPFPDCVHQLRRRAGPPLVVVLDHGSLPPNTRVQAVQPALRRQRLDRYYLPSSSPALHRIAAVFGGLTAQDLPARAYRSDDDWEAAIDLACTHAEQRLLTTPSNQPRLAA